MNEHETASEIPAGFAAVTQEEFFRLLAADPRDIMSCHDQPYSTTWETVKVTPRTVWGWSFPGWKNGGNPNTPKVYAVREGVR